MNRSKNWAVRLSPDLILDEFGNEDARVLCHLRRNRLPVSREEEVSDSRQEQQQTQRRAEAGQHGGDEGVVARQL